VRLEGFGTGGRGRGGYEELGFWIFRFLYMYKGQLKMGLYICVYILARFLYTYIENATVTKKSTTRNVFYIFIFILIEFSTCFFSIY
jgi:hypothetical protein